MDDLRHGLRKRGFRLTPQREKILQFFKDLPKGSHLSAEEVHRRMVERQEKISLATAYRTLKLLASMGLLRELDLAEGHKHYEIRDVSHQHLICTRCGRTIEFHGAKLFEVGAEIARKHDFEILDVQFKIFGLCQECRGR